MKLVSQILAVAAVATLIVPAFAQAPTMGKPMMHGKKPMMKKPMMKKKMMMKKPMMKSTMKPMMKPGMKPMAKPTM